jgi:amidase
VAAGHVNAAIGTQTNGSVVRPAAYCGVVGFKPTLAAIPVAGVYPFSPMFDTVGTFTRTIADAAVLASVLTDGSIAPAISPLAKTPRLAYLRAFPWVQQDGDSQAVVDAAVARLAAVAEVVPVAIAAPWHEANRIHRAIMLFEAARTLGELQQRERARLTPAINAALDEGRTIGDDRYREALDARARAIAFFTDWLAGFDAVLAPAAPGPAPKTLAATGDPSCCTLWSLLGFPALTLPVGLAGRLPMGLQLAAPQEHDDRVLSVAAWCEARLPFRALE